jgi:hypothetical protein
VAWRRRRSLARSSFTLAKHETTEPNETKISLIIGRARGRA